MYVSIHLNLPDMHIFTYLCKYVCVAIQASTCQCLFAVLLTVYMAVCMYVYVCLQFC